MSNLTAAYAAAVVALDRYPSCILDPQAYGPTKCRRHTGGTRYPHETHPWCSESGPSGPLHQALADLVAALDVSITPKEG